MVSKVYKRVLCLFLLFVLLLPFMSQGFAANIFEECSWIAVDGKDYSNGMCSSSNVTRTKSYATSARD
ncbi:MAG TPA: hypothetical protein PLP35_08945 [Caldisericia bacterium]|nr:hypothetical protein [Caldisericia bacterium]HRV75696.1 hypothetical protein [Caldisericia bacterium]